MYLHGSLGQRQNEFLIIKVPCYATASVSQKVLDFFAHLKATSKHSTTGSHLTFVW